MFSFLTHNTLTTATPAIQFPMRVNVVKERIDVNNRVVMRTMESQIQLLLLLVHQIYWVDTFLTLIKDVDSIAEFLLKQMDFLGVNHGIRFNTDVGIEFSSHL